MKPNQTLFKTSIGTIEKAFLWLTMVWAGGWLSPGLRKFSAELGTRVPWGLQGSSSPVFPNSPHSEVEVPSGLCPAQAHTPTEGHVVLGKVRPLEQVRAALGSAGPPPASSPLTLTFPFPAISGSRPAVGQHPMALFQEADLVSRDIKGLSK